MVEVAELQIYGEGFVRCVSDGGVNVSIASSSWRHLGDHMCSSQYRIKLS